jgi:hypothetical protein
MVRWLPLLIWVAVFHPCFAQTTLSDPKIAFKVPEKHYVVLKRAAVEAVIVDNNAVDDEKLKGHRAGYSGVGSLTHEKNKTNLFVPAVAGLNFEHIHDGTTHPRPVLFEPRNFPMELRVIDDHTVELYQKPTPNWFLESCQRYELLEDGVIQLTVECIPRKRTFKNGYIGLFWASYINRPESLKIHFLGHGEGEAATPRWIEASTPSHGVDAVHLASGDGRAFPHDADFPMTLVFNRSEFRFSEPWCFGVCREFAYVQMFRASDNVRFAQSPSGGGNGNPAWDFQFFIQDYQVDHLYRFVMRAAYVPMTTPAEVRQSIQPHLKALNPK